MTYPDHTVNYNLPLHTPDHKPTWLGDVNTVTTRVDELIHEAKQTAQGAQDSVGAAIKSAQRAEDAADKATDAANTATGKLDELSNDITKLKGVTTAQASALTGLEARTTQMGSELATTTRLAEQASQAVVRAQSTADKAVDDAAKAYKEARAVSDYANEIASDLWDLPDVQQGYVYIGVAQGLNTGDHDVRFNKPFDNASVAIVSSCNNDRDGVYVSRIMGTTADGCHITIQRVDGKTEPQTRDILTHWIAVGTRKNP